MKIASIRIFYLIIMIIGVFLNVDSAVIFEQDLHLRDSLLPNESVFMG